MSYIMFTFYVLISAGPPTSQALTGTWGTLSMVTFTREYNEDWGIDVEIPKVSPVVSAMAGQEITVTGYLIPLDAKTESSHVMLSAYPVSNCFFCGKAGPETAMQVFVKDGKKITYTDEKVTMKGILRINEKDINSLLYTMEQGQLVD